MVRNKYKRHKYKEDELVMTAEQHAQQLIDRREKAGKKGLPKAVQRYRKRLAKSA